jgi:ParB family transcriptional regulator, chromosome partitioning protein
LTKLETQVSDINNEIQNKKKGLGRGLGSLLQTHTTSTLSNVEVIESKPVEIEKNEEKTETPKIIVPPKQTQPKPLNQAPPLELSSTNQEKMWMLSIEKIKSGKYQPRKNFNKQALDELTSSIKMHGILQPIVVRSVGAGQYEIIAGERRWRAAQAAGLHEVPVIIKTYNNQTTLELSLIENLQREDLNPIEEAEGYLRLMSEFSLTQEKVAEKVGKERTTVANALRLLKLAPSIREMVQTGQISQGHAKVLLSLVDQDQQKELAKAVTSESLSVRKLEELVQKKLTQKNSSENPIATENGVTNRLIAGLNDEVQKLLGTKVNIDYKFGKGKMSIYFYSDDELTSIVEKVRAGVKI